MSSPSLHLAVADFDAYLPERATSNAYSRPRIEIKQRVLAWARRVMARLADLGIAVEVHGSDEHPSLRNKKRVDCQWVFFWRDQAAREELERLLDRGRSISAAIGDPNPSTRHAFLALRLDATAVEVCFAVHPEASVDIDNLRARLVTASADGQEGTGPLAAEFTRALDDLPEQFLLGVGADRFPCGATTPEALMDMLQRAAAGQVPLWIGWSVSRDVALEHAAILDEQLEDAIIALAPIYRLVAWSRDNDHIALDRRLEGAERERARAHAEAEAETERWRAEREAERVRSVEQARARHDGDGPRAGEGPHRMRERTLGNLFDSGEGRARTFKADGRGAGSKATDAPWRHPEQRRPEHQRPVSEPPTSGPLDPPIAVAPAGAVPPLGIEKGGRVRVLFGPFADKCGTVSELDGRGGARVLLGLLSTRLDLAHLAPVVDARDRRALQSSHRRPDPRGTVPRRSAPDPRKAR